MVEVNLSSYFKYAEPMENEMEKTITDFEQVVSEILALHERKQADYGRGPKDPFANIKASEEWNVAPWIGALIRANDKVRRLQAAARGQNLRNESVEDSLLDLATYSIIALVLYRDTPAYRSYMQANVG